MIAFFFFLHILFLYPSLRASSLLFNSLSLPSFPFLHSLHFSIHAFPFIYPYLALIYLSLPFCTFLPFLSSLHCYPFPSNLYPLFFIFTLHFLSLIISFASLLLLQFYPFLVAPSLPSLHISSPYSSSLTFPSSLPLVICKS